MANDTPSDVWESPFSAPPEDTSNRPFGVDDPDPIEQADASAEPDPPASMSMTKAELLARVEKLEAERDAARTDAVESMTKAELIEHAKEIEAETAAIRDPDAPRVSRATLAAMPGVLAADATETHNVTINGVTYSWTAATEDTVPEEARAIWARYKAANS